MTVRGENYVQVLDGKTFKEKSRITTAFGPGMTIFSPDGKYGYVCDSFNPATYVIDVHTHKVIHEVPQASAFCPDIAATPDGKQVWFTALSRSVWLTFTPGPAEPHASTGSSADA